jgi:hypothetical protein
LHQEIDKLNEAGRGQEKYFYSFDLIFILNNKFLAWEQQKKVLVQHIHQKYSYNKKIFFCFLFIYLSQNRLLVMVLDFAI